MTRSEKLCEVNRSTSLLDESNRSDAARSSSIALENQIAKTVPALKGQQVEIRKFEFGLKTV